MKIHFVDALAAEVAKCDHHGARLPYVPSDWHSSGCRRVAPFELVAGCCGKAYIYEWK